MDNCISIQVSGVCGSGKSTIAKLIADTLSHDFDNIVVYDDNGYKVKDEFMNQKLQAIRKNTRINIQVQSINRSIKHKENV